MQIDLTQTRTFAAPLLFLTLALAAPGAAHAQSVDDLGVTIDRYQIGLSFQDCFCADLFGTGIVAVTVTSPVNANPPFEDYAMVYVPEEDQWAYDQVDDPAVIASRFPDGEYVFTVSYAEQEDEFFGVTLTRDFPPFPVVNAFNNDRIGWEPWNGSPNGTDIEVFVEGPNDTFASCDLPVGATACDLPPGFVVPNGAYAVDILFVSKSGLASNSNSGLIKACLAEDSDGDGVFDDGDCSAIVGDNVCADQTEGCDDNCRRVANPDQLADRTWFDFEFNDPNPIAWGRILGTARARSEQRVWARWAWRFPFAGFIEYRYAGAGGSPTGIYGVCAWNHGVNRGLYRGTLPLSPGSGPGHANPSPGIITDTWWLNIDGGVDDDQNGRLDAFVWYYNACDDETSFGHIDVAYPSGCTWMGDDAISPATSTGFTTLVPGCDIPDENWAPAAGSRAAAFGGGGIESAAWLALLEQQLANLQPTSEPKGLWAFAECDLDHDGDCDAADRQLAIDAAGTCLGDVGFNPLADADADGCVDATDEAALFDQDLDADGVSDLVDNCLTDSNASQADQDTDGAGDACDCAVSDPLTRPNGRETNDGIDNDCPGDTGFGLIDEIEPQAAFDDPSDPTAFCWPVQDGATRYEVARLSGGCVTTPLDAPARCLSDPSVPLPGQRFDYLVRTLLPNAGSWGETAPGVERSGVCP